MMRRYEDGWQLMRRCKDCGCIISISDPPLPNRTGYYCQGCGEDKKIYQTYEAEE